MIPATAIATYASNVIGVPVAISCEADATFAIPTDDGFVLFGEDGYLIRVLHIRQTLCDAASAADRNSGAALEVILHEAIHIGLQSVNESVVECVAISNAWPFVRQFRLAARITRAVLAGMQARHAAFPAAYHSTGGC